ncbi:MAG: hypothetical protein ABUT39_30240 [Acidobacteriota bacterium]
MTRTSMVSVSLLALLCQVGAAGAQVSQEKDQAVRIVREHRGVPLAPVEEAAAAAVAEPEDPRSLTAAAIVGTASFSTTINYLGTLYYYVTGGPPNTCGELNTYRNGAWLYAANWLCTDASGNATKGPWTWAGTPSDQTDEPAYIRWPDGSTTNNALHIWDKACATTFVTTPAGSPPTTYAGYSTDVQWGAGFDFNPYIKYTEFKDLTTGLYWDPTTHAYSASYRNVPLNLTRVNRWRVNWTTSFPAPGDHVSGHNYAWWSCMTDSNCGTCSTRTFTAP